MGPFRLLFIVLVTTACWLAATLRTRPVGVEHLTCFYREVPPGGWWGPVARATAMAPTSLKRDLALWAAATAFIFGGLFGLGSLLLLAPAQAAAYFAPAAAGGLAVARLLSTS